MNRYLGIGMLVVGVLIILPASIVLAAPPDDPPGRDPCSHGRTDKECRADPQPDRGKDCEKHGNQGGVNEDHCGAGPSIQATATRTPRTNRTPEPTRTPRDGATATPTSTATLQTFSQLPTIQATPEFTTALVTPEVTTNPPSAPEPRTAEVLASPRQVPERPVVRGLPPTGSGGYMSHVPDQVLWSTVGLGMSLIGFGAMILRGGRP